MLLRMLPTFEIVPLNWRPSFKPILAKIKCESVHAVYALVHLVYRDVLLSAVKIVSGFYSHGAYS